LFALGLLPSVFRLIAVGRSVLTSQEYQEMVGQIVNPDGGEQLQAFLGTITYMSGDVTDFATFEKLRELHETQTKHGCGNHLWYIATLPSLYVSIAKFIGQSGLNQSKCGWTKLLIEKPFGVDVESARQLNTFLGTIFKENQIFRTDHVLAKETVQNLLAFRFGNGLFEHLWSNEYVANIQVNYLEAIGIEGRGEFYDGVGAVRDVMQNHVMQLMTMALMEEPESLARGAINGRRDEFLKSLRVWQGDVSKYARFGQYGLGEVDGQKVGGYLEESGLEVKSSNTETAAAAVLESTSKRWKGVPIFVRTGKRMGQTVREISIQFKEPKNKLFGSVGQMPNVLTLRIQPNEGVVLRLNAKKPGLSMKTEEVPMQFCYNHVFQMGLLEAYVKLIYDAIVGDGMLFPSAEGIELSWEVVEPLLVHERQPEFAPESYAAGSFGPKSFDALVKSFGFSWIEPSVAVCAI